MTRTARTRPKPALFLLLLSSITLLPAAVWALAAPTADPGPSGRRKNHAAGAAAGTVQVGPEIEKRRVNFPIYADMSRQAASLPETTLEDELRNVIVYLETEAPPEVNAANEPSPAVLRQVNETFEPHVLPIMAGTTVEFPNGDPFFHNVFSLSRASAFDLGHYPKGSSRSVTFDEPGLVKVFCHLHSNMSAVIMVLDNPWFAVPGDQGTFRIDGIPPGRHTVVAWHERARPVRRDVTIEAGRTVMLDLRVPLHDPHPED